MQGLCAVTNEIKLELSAAAVQEFKRATEMGLGIQIGLQLGNQVTVSAGASDPTGLSSLVAWWDGADEATFAKTGSLVDSWTSKGPNAYVATATGAARPDHSVDTVTFTSTEFLSADLPAAITGQKTLVAVIGFSLIAGATNSFATLKLNGSENTSSLAGASTFNIQNLLIGGKAAGSESAACTVKQIILLEDPSADDIAFAESYVGARIA